jgi:hypothetical protein
VPAYWRVLAEPVPPEKGLPHLRNVRLSNFTVTSAKEAFSVDAYREAPLLDVAFQNIDIRADKAGTIANAENWKFVNTRVQAADGSRVTVKDSRGVTGLPAN